MSAVHVKEFPAILRLAFPGYSGRKFKVESSADVTLHSDSWEGGSKVSYRLIDLETGEVRGVTREFGNPYTNPSGQVPTVALRPGLAVVAHSIFCGKDTGLTAYLHPDNFVAMLPPAIEMSADERRALDIIGSYKGGHHRAEAWRGLPGRYEAANPLIQSLAAKRLVTINRAGAVAITTEGRNARSR